MTKIEVDQIYVKNNAALYLITSPTNVHYLQIPLIHTIYYYIIYQPRLKAVLLIKSYFTDKFEVDTKDGT